MYEEEDPDDCYVDEAMHASSHNYRLLTRTDYRDINSSIFICILGFFVR